MTATACMTSSAGWTATRPSTTPTSPKPAANAMSASRKPTFRVCMANCWPGATSAARFARIVTRRTRLRNRRGTTSRLSATRVAANATRTGLLLGTFAFFGLHNLLWLVRAIWLYLHDSKKFREAKVKTQVDDEWFTRFVPFERFLHFLVVTDR